MSQKHPVIAVTGASGAGTTAVQLAFKEIFFRQKINAAFIQGDGFLRYNEAESEKMISQALADGRHLSCYGPDLNDFKKLEDCFKHYAQNGSCDMRFKITEENKHLYQEPVGEFTQWQQSPSHSDCLFYEGMHGGVVAQTWTRRKSENTDTPLKDRRSDRSNSINAAQYVDLLIGVVPAINLEWIQRIQHDQIIRKQSAEQVTANILEQLQDYIYFIVPQFSITDINFQRMPVVDTSNPFDLQPVPTEKESIIVISFKEPDKYNLDTYLKRIDGSFMSGRSNLVIPGGQMQHALDVICAPLIEALITTEEEIKDTDI
ncbi:Phosphoribulokinase [hydrothermal vent metagenome]|uniref:phosphoribulokinase n=1 Tax=hydrothermal vent metagenome TaxID=652676 RepID=A0A3B0XT56_9ZZZZ